MAWRFNNETKKVAYYETLAEAEAAQGEKKMPIFSTKEELTDAKISIKDLVFIYNGNIEEGQPQIAGFKNRAAGVDVVFALLNGDELPTEGIKAPAEPKAPKVPGGGKGQRGRFEGKKLYPVMETNPRREGSFGWRSLNIIMENPGISTKEYLEKGGRLRDLQWDVERNQTRVE